MSNLAIKVVVAAYKRFQIQWFDLQTFGILENWSLRRGGCLREVVTTRGSTVIAEILVVIILLNNVKKHTGLSYIEQNNETKKN